MSATKFSPGPWQASFPRGLPPMVRSASVCAGRASLVCVFTPDAINRDANLALVAAAPDLYAALEEVAGILLDGMQRDHDDMTAALGRARAALAKARGETD